MDVFMETLCHTSDFPNGRVLEATQESEYACLSGIKGFANCHHTITDVAGHAINGTLYAFCGYCSIYLSDGLSVCSPRHVTA